MRIINVWSRNRRALSPIFATVLLATIVIVFGSIAYYYSNNLTTTASNNYTKTVSDSQQSLTERIGFENVAYSQSSATLKVYIVNCGSANNVKISSVFIYDSNHQIIGTYSGNQISALFPIDGAPPSPAPTPGNPLNSGQEAYFVVSLTGSSLTGPVYTIHLITQSGSFFDYEFTP